MRIIIFGSGPISEILVKNLEMYDDEVTVCDYSRKLYRKFDEKRAEIVAGNLLDDEFLKNLNLNSYDYALILKDDDRLNLILTTICKNEGVSHIITKINTYDDIHSLFNLKSSFGMEYIINEDLESSRYIMRMVEEDIGIKSDIFAGGKVLLSSIKAEFVEDFVGKKLEDLGSLSTILVVGILREGNLLIPDGKTVVERNDILYLMGLSNDILSFKNTHFHLEEKRKKKEMTIIGDSFLTRAIVENQKSMNIKIIEEDSKKVEDLRIRYKDAFVIKNSFKRELKTSEEEFSSADVLLAATNSDELNIVTGLLASGIGIKDVILKVNSMTYNRFIDSLPVDAVINPHTISAGVLLKLLGKNAGMNIYHMFGDRAEVMEVKLREKSSLVGRNMESLALPRGIVIGAIVRKNNMAIIPRGQSTIEDEDTLVIFFKKQNRDELLRFLGVPKKSIFPTLFGVRK